MRKGIQHLSKRQQKRWRIKNELARTLDVEAFLRDVVGVGVWHKSGAEYIFSCPLPFGLHSRGDKNPSAAFNAEKLLFHCFNCGGGDIFWFAQNVLDRDSDFVIRELRGVSVYRDQTASEFMEELEKNWAEAESSLEMPVYSESILKPWVRVCEYFTERGISPLVQEEMKTGIDENYRFQIDEKLVTQRRVVIPHFFEGKLRGWSKRKIDEGDEGTKYRHSPGIPRDRTLFHWDAVADDRVDPLLIVESPMTVLRLKSEGVERVVATFGSKVSEGQLDLLKGFREVWFWFDGDYAGQDKVRDAVARLMDHTKVWYVPCPDERDPGDMDREEVDKWLNERRPGMLI